MLRRSFICCASMWSRKPSYLPGGNEPEVQLMARLSPTPYCGRRGAPPTSIQATLDPSKRWCTLCCLAVPQLQWTKHEKSWKHKSNSRKEANLEDFALDLWEKHRGAKIDEASFVEKEGSRAQEQWRERVQGDKAQFDRRLREADLTARDHGVLDQKTASNLLMKPMQRFPNDRRR
jgi:hypothetical protein